MIVDSSAIVAILTLESDAPALARALDGSDRLQVSAVTLLESSMVLTKERFGDLDEFVDAAGIEVVPFDQAQAVLAREAFTRYGKKSGSKAQLNFGDCMTYALAKVTGEPLLFKGDDFTHTDVTPAL